MQVQGSWHFGIVRPEDETLCCICMSDGTAMRCRRAIRQMLLTWQAAPSSRSGQQPASDVVHGEHCPSTAGSDPQPRPGSWPGCAGSALHAAPAWPAQAASSGLCNMSPASHISDPLASCALFTCGMSLGMLQQAHEVRRPSLSSERAARRAGLACTGIIQKRWTGCASMQAPEHGCAAIAQSLHA